MHLTEIVPANPLGQCANRYLIAKQNMKTIMDLLISLQHFEHSLHLATRDRQLTPLEKSAAGRHLDLIREIIPTEALLRYEQMKKTDAELLANPEIFAMAAVVATYRKLSPVQRRKFVARFGTVPNPHSHRPKTRVRHLNGCQKALAARPARARFGCGYEPI